MKTIPVKIYGASDDYMLGECPVSGEHWSLSDQYDSCGPTFLIYEAPNGETLTVRGEYCRPGADTEWEVVVHENKHGWKVEETTRFPDDDYDPALIIHIPTGTTLRDRDAEED